MLALKQKAILQIDIAKCNFFAHPLYLSVTFEGFKDEILQLTSLMNEYSHQTGQQTNRERSSENSGVRNMKTEEEFSSWKRKQCTNGHL